MNADVIVVGAGLAGIVAAAELAEAGRRVILVEQEPASSLGGQAFWSLGGSRGGHRRAVTLGRNDYATTSAGTGPGRAMK